jgi:hypothetical protein
MFDANQFMQSSSSEAFDTKFQTIDAGEYTGTVAEVTPKQFESKKEPGTYFTVLEIKWNLQLTAADIEKLGRDSASVRQTIFLDLNEQGNMAIGKGKNIALGRLRDALGQNVPGQSWGPGNLIGAAGVVTVKHNMRTGEPFPEVDHVTPF